MLRQTVLVTLIATALFTSGCAVKPLNHNFSAIKDTRVCPEVADNNVDELCNAINLADGYRRGYLHRAGLISGTRENFGYAVIAASTLALYYGASPQPTRTNAAGVMIAAPNYSQRVRRLGAFGAGVYAYGQWGSPKARDLVYIDGARAMTCAVLKAAPTLPAIKLRDKIEEQRKAVQNALDSVQASLNNRQISNADEAEAMLGNAREQIDEAEGLLAEVESAGVQLRARVQLIDVAVRRRLVDDSPTFESLVALTASLPGIARSLGASLAPRAAAGATAARGGGAPTPIMIDLEPLRKAIEILKKTVASLTRLRSTIDSVGDCAVGDGAKFSFAPTATSASIVKDATYQVLVSDPVGHPTASIAGGQVASLELKPIEITGKDDEYRITVTGKVVTSAEAKPILAIRSASGLSGADISLTVTAAQPQEVTPKIEQKPLQVDQCDSVDSCDYDTDFLESKQNILALQCLVGAKPDCIMGAKTRMKISEYRTSKRYSSGNFVDAKVKTDLGSILIEINNDAAKYNCSMPPLTCPPSL